MKTIKKAFRILDLMLEHGEELALEDLSRLSGLDKATVRRIALTLMEGGYLKQLERRGKYSLGMRFLDFSGVIKKNNGIIHLANPYLFRLSRQVEESVVMALWDGMTAVQCQSFHLDQLLKAVPSEGTLVGMHHAALGKAIVAEMSDEELERYFEKGLERKTPKTITSLKDLKSNLLTVKKQGVAFDDEEYALGVRSVAAVLRSGWQDVVGSMGIIGPSVRLSWPKLREYAPYVKNCAMEISKELGYKGK